MMLGSESETATHPVEPSGTLPSVIGVHVAPPSVVRNSPPLATPMKNVFGCDGTPVTVVTRPPRAGPTSRYRKPLKNDESTVCEWTEITSSKRASNTEPDRNINRPPDTQIKNWKPIMSQERTNRECWPRPGGRIEEYA